MDLSAIWAFSERIGQMRGLSLEQVGFYLALSMPFQALGSAIAAVLGVRLGWLLPLLTALLIQLAAIALRSYWIPGS